MKSNSQPRDYAHVSEIDYQGLQGEPDGKQEVVAKGCRDPAFAVAFLATAGLMVYYATQGAPNVFGNDDCLHDDACDDGGMSSIDSELWGDDDDAEAQTNQLIMAFVGLAAFAGVMCTVWMSLVMKYPENYITCGYYTYVCLVAVSAGIAIALKQVAAALICLFFLMLIWCSWRAIKARIPFAAANLATACTALNAHKSVMCVVVFMLILSLAWSFTVALAANGMFDGVGEVSGIVVFGVLVAYYWGGMICANVSHVSIAGTVGSWWFSPPEDASASYAVTSSFRRAMTSSFGSIAFGSLLVAVLEAMKQMCREAQRQNNSMLACCAACIIGCIEGLVRYINRYAFVYVGLYGHDFCAAGSHVFGLFNHRGWIDTILNDDLIGNALNYGALMVGLICGVAGYALAQIMFTDPTTTLQTVIAAYGFITGFVMACVTANSVYSAVATVYVAFAESHVALQNNHPETFYKLYDAWNHFHPQLVTYIVVQQQAAPYGQIYEQGAVQNAPVVNAVHVDRNGEPIY